jgi:hypothetical protein
MKTHALEAIVFGIRPRAIRRLLGFVMIGVPSKCAVPLLIIVHACNAIRAIKVDRTTIRAVPSFSRVAVIARWGVAERVAW